MTAEQSLREGHLEESLRQLRLRVREPANADAHLEEGGNAVPGHG
ncbi:MAG TPA: hypothetical protein VF573_10295 [Paraburkholderia sp.]